MAEDTRSALTVLRQFEVLEKWRRQLIKAGLVGEDATPAEVIDAMRRAIPPDLFGDVRPPTH